MGWEGGKFFEEQVTHVFFNRNQNWKGCWAEVLIPRDTCCIKRDVISTRVYLLYLPLILLRYNHRNGKRLFELIIARRRITGF